MSVYLRTCWKESRNFNNSENGKTKYQVFWIFFLTGDITSPQNDHWFRRKCSTNDNERPSNYYWKRGRDYKYIKRSEELNIHLLKKRIQMNFFKYLKITNWDLNPSLHSWNEKTAKEVEPAPRKINIFLW